VTTSAMVSVDRLTKHFGSRVAVSSVSFQVAPGEILGFLGPNGAGKTTTMRMMTGFLAPSSGSATIAGHDIRTEALEAKAKLGYLCETPPVYREMTVAGYLRFVAEIKRIPAGKRGALIDRAVTLCGLGEVVRRVIGHLSKGYRQRVGLAQAILHRPPVLILDEPTVGLDPRQVIEMREVIRGLAGEQSVVLSTHILPEVQKTCSSVVIIDEGKIVAADAIENLSAGGDRFQTLRLVAARDLPDLASKLEALPNVSEARRESPGTYLIRVERADGAEARVAAAVAACDAELVALSQERTDLEEIFLKLVTKETGEGTA
jgi:ABC-2 type transport system ATP-binding protein